MIKVGTYSKYLKALVDRIFKILPLYEEKNEGLFKNIQSLIYELYGLEEVFVYLKSDADFITLLATLEALSDDAIDFSNDRETVKREVFKCINIVKRIEERATESSDK